MTNCSLQPPMPWSAATAATAKCKRQFIGFARRRISTTVSPWTCSAIPKRRTELKLLKPSTTSERAKKVPLMMLKTLIISSYAKASHAVHDQHHAVAYANPTCSDSTIIDVVLANQDGNGQRKMLIMQL